MINNPTSEKLTFLTLIEKHNIEIPIIQRDYAQGRKGKEELRKDFLNSLLTVVVNGKELELDFVYGNVKKDSEEKMTFQPLDGQQRLTTLFLLHWYIATKENKLNDNRELLSKFTYETRTSSREFCIGLINKGINFDKLLETDYHDEEKTKPKKNQLSKTIIDSSWFFLSWKRDLTIKSMLTMLDAIHQTFSETTTVWDYLNKISFHYIELQNFGLSDDLYIKMNARGKALTEFENFKAKFEQHITQKKWEKEITNPIETFSHKIDTDWTNLFWNYRNDKNVFDEQILNFIAGIAIQLYAQNQEIFSNNEDETSVIKELEVKSKGKTVTDENVKRERIEKRIALLFNDFKSIKPEDFPTKNSFDHLKNCFNLYSITNSDYHKLIPKLSLWGYVGDDKSLFSTNINTDKESTYKQRVLFYAQTVYFLKSSYDENTFNDWMRVVRNIVENSTIDSATTFIGAISLISELSKGCESIYDYLSKTGISSRFAEEQVKEETRKATLIINDNKFKNIIFKLEDTLFCKGSINWCLDCYGVIGELEKIKDIIDTHLSSNDISNLFRRALLTTGDNNFYNYWGSWSYNTSTHKRCLIANRQDLKNNFTKKNWFLHYLKPLINQLCNNGNNLQWIVEHYTNTRMPNWKVRLITEPNLLDDHCENHYIGITDDNSECYLYRSKQRPANRAECEKIV